jgi:hypothetical protein
MGERSLISESQELDTTGYLAEGILNLRQAFTHHLWPVFRDIKEVLGIFTHSFKESE